MNPNAMRTGARHAGSAADGAVGGTRGERNMPELTQGGNPAGIAPGARYLRPRMTLTSSTSSTTPAPNTCVAAAFSRALSTAKSTFEPRAAVSGVR